MHYRVTERCKRFSSGKATHTEIYEEVAKSLEARYPNHVLPKRDREWIFVNAGGWMASFYLMHASITEYVYFMGTAMHTSGHAGEDDVLCNVEAWLIAAADCCVQIVHSKCSLK